MTVGANNHLYRCLKKMECSSQGMLFEIPQADSEAFKALDLSPGEVWKLGCLTGMLIWFREKTTAASNRVFMETRPDLKEEASGEAGELPSES